jgi:hypothetical protein
MPEYWGYKAPFEKTVVKKFDGNRAGVEVMEYSLGTIVVTPFEADSIEMARVIVEMQCRRERMISKVIHTSVDEGIRYGVLGIDDVEILEDCLNREKWGGKRATLMKAIEARIRKLGRTTKEV